MPNEPSLPRDWAARMIPTLTEVVDDPGAAEAPETQRAPAPRPSGAGLHQIEPELRRKIVDAVSAAVREQLADLGERVGSAVERAVSAAIAEAQSPRHPQ